MKITIVGTGYVGLVSGACFAEVGVDVTCIDVDKDKINKLNNGIIPIFEPGLETLVVNNKQKDRIKFSTDLKEAIQKSEVVFIAVGTPPDEDGSADLQHVLKVASEIGKYMNDYLLIVTKSTVPVGTAQKIKKAVEKELNNRGVDITFDIGSNPEFLKEGAAIEDFMKPARIIVGVESEKAKSYMQKLYQPFTLNGHPIIFMDMPSAEMTKYAANAMLATRISFMNEIANLCEILGANVNMVREGIGSDPRIGNKFIFPGIGYGGSCFPKDVKALIKTAKEKKYKLNIIEAVENTNNKQKTVMVDKIKAHFKGELKNLKVALWGLSFKPQTDDMREAPSIEIIKELLKEGCKISAYDPEAMTQAKSIIGNEITYAGDKEEAIIDADCLVLVTEWNGFKIPNFQVMKKLMKQAVVFDGRNLYDEKELGNLGFDYYGIGIKPVLNKK